jgi:zinc protease
VRHARTFDEMVEDVNAVTLEKIKAFHAQFYGAAKGEFGAAGDMDVAQVRSALQAALGDWTAGAPFKRVPMPLVKVAPERIVLSTPDKQNANLFARLAVPLSDNDADYPALMVANYLLGSGGAAAFRGTATNRTRSGWRARSSRRRTWPRSNPRCARRSHAR